MVEAAPESIFVSYARRDGAELALRLQQDLTVAGFDVWLDTQRITGGATWTVAIEQAIDRAQVVLVVLTPAAYSSEICRAEQLRSLRSQKCVIPLRAAQETDIPLHLEAKNYRDFTQEGTYQKNLEFLVDDIRAGNGIVLKDRYRFTPNSYITAPHQVANYIDRPEAVRALRDALFEVDENRVLAVTALVGMGGIGKTVLAQALFRDEVIRQAFPDGLVWITVGREPTHDVATRLREITNVLGSASSEAVSAKTLYRSTIFEKAALIVIDDIWSKADVEDFLAESPRSRFLLTTRDASIARYCGAREHRLDLLGSQQGRELLARWAGCSVAALPPAADDILEECAGLPLALSVVGGLLDSDSAAWVDTAERLRNADLASIEDQLPPGQESVFRAIDMSVRTLSPKLRQCYERLAVLPEDSPAAIPVVQTLWNTNDADSRLVMRQLTNRSLAQKQGESAIRLHDVQSDYIRSIYPDRKALDLIRSAVRLSWHVIEKDPLQFASQVLGRLLVHGASQGIRAFMDDIARGAPRPWLRPIHPALQQADTPLFRTLEGHSAPVQGVAVTPDGHRAVSASWDNTLKVWDLKRGRALHTLQGHSNGVCAVAVTPDGHRAVSASWDNSLKVWDLETGWVLRTLEGHRDAVFAVSITPDGKRAVSASGDKTLRVWDLESGHALHTLKGHRSDVFAVCVTPDGKRAVSACAAQLSKDRTLKVWDLETGCAVRTLKGHSDGVIGVAVTPDGKRLISASRDDTLKLWDLESGDALRTLEGHSVGRYVRGVAVTPDGKQAISASGDKTLKVWDLESGRLLQTLEGHSDSVNGVALTPDGRRAVSASSDNTLKVWDLRSGSVLHSTEGHADSVSAIAVTRDGQWAVSGSDDHTLKVWDLESCSMLWTLKRCGDVYNLAVTPDGQRAVCGSALWHTLTVWELETGRALRTLEGHSDSVWGVAVTPDGRAAVSASGDKTLKVWELETGRALRTLEGHSDSVWGLAVTPDGRRAVSASGDKTLRVWHLGTGRTMCTLEGHSADVSGVAVTPDGKRAVSASSDTTLKVWDLESGRALCTLEGHSDSVHIVKVAPDREYAVSASADKALKVWDLETGQVIAAFYCETTARCVAFIRGGRIVAGDTAGRIYFLALEDSVTCKARNRDQTL